MLLLSKSMEIVQEHSWRLDSGTYRENSSVQPSLPSLLENAKNALSICYPFLDLTRTSSMSEEASPLTCNGKRKRCRFRAVFQASNVRGGIQQKECARNDHSEAVGAPLRSRADIIGPESCSCND